MPNQRKAGIVNVSFTMPAALAEALEARARAEMTNKSEVVRRALLASLSPEEADRVRRSVLEEEPAKYRAKPAKKKKA